MTANALWPCSTSKEASEWDDVHQDLKLTPELALRVREKSMFCDFVHAFLNKHHSLKQQQELTNGVYGGFRNLKKIGEGAHGIVYKAEEVATGRKYAVKEVAKPDTERGFENCTRWKALMTEIEVLSELSSSHCVRMHKLIQLKTSICMVLEFVKGTNLQIYAATNAVSERDCSEIAAHILSALAYLHDVKHIVHRDIKPENVLIHRKDGPIEPRITSGACVPQPLGTKGDRFVVKLVDFGSSRFVQEGLLGGRYGDIDPYACAVPLDLPAECVRASSESTTGLDAATTNPTPSPSQSPMRESNSSESYIDRSHDFDSVSGATPVGTSLYLALETINITLNMEDLPTIDVKQLPKVDMFSLGVVIYILICRVHPFMGNVTDSPESMASKMVDGAGNTRLSFPDEADMEFAISPQCMDFLSSLLAHQPDRRLSSASALLHPWIVCRHYACEAPRKKCIEQWVGCAAGCTPAQNPVFTAPEEMSGVKRPRSLTNDWVESAHASKRRTV
eukprot:Rhum_TRINITY_DN2344_c0_g1::Rhum_TRINITY_DN2344_c0_g1_i1::g.6863::m.6863